MKLESFFDSRTFTVTYVVWDEATRDAVVIDPVLDYDPNASRTWTESADAVVAFLREHNLTLRTILETHAHADHLSGAPYIKDAFPDASVAIGKHITDVQAMFKGIFDLPESFATDGSQFSTLLDDGEVLHAGSIDVKTWYTPGHTPACVTFQIDDMLFTGDLLFMPDMGTGRCDFPGGSTEAMYDSIKRLYDALPDETRVLVGHDYAPGGRDFAWESTLGENKRANIWITDQTDRATFIEKRAARDKGLAAPKLLFQSVQVNIDAGRLPDPHANDIRYLRIPINVFRPADVPTEDLALETV